jgi:hypothetical protein
MITGLSILSVLCAACAAAPATQQRTAGTTTPTRINPASPREWLGLNYDSSTDAGGVTDFSRYGIVYDRLGSFDLPAGATVRDRSRLARGLRVSLRVGMIPDVVIGPVHGPVGCSSNPNTSDLCLPDTPLQIHEYVRGFIETARSMERAAPGHRIVFEPMDEPWDWAPPPGTSSGVSAADDYAAALAQLLPAAKAAGIPLSLIYVPATGLLKDATNWVPDLYRAQPCLQPGPHSCGPVEGWNLHSYGPPGSSRGIDGVPAVRAQMRSGENNLIVSELGFCATDVLDGSHCDRNTPTVDGSSELSAHRLTQALEAALKMHQAGWLRALIVWERSAGGWSMQLPNGTLTAQGQALVQFARSASR